MRSKPPERILVCDRKVRRLIDVRAPRLRVGGEALKTKGSESDFTVSIQPVDVQWLCERDKRRENTGVEDLSNQDEDTLAPVVAKERQKPSIPFRSDRG